MTNRFLKTFFFSFLTLLLLSGLFMVGISDFIFSLSPQRVFPTPLLLSMPLLLAMVAMLVARIVCPKEKFIIRSRLSLWSDVAILLGFIILSAIFMFLRANIDLTRTLHEKDNLIIGLCCAALMAVAVVAVKDVIKRYKAIPPGSGMRPGMFWQQFMVCSLMLACWYSFVGLILTGRGYQEGAMLNLYLFIGYFILIALLVSMGMTLIKKLWKESLGVAIFLGVLLAVLLFFSELVFHIKITTENDHDYHTFYDEYYYDRSWSSDLDSGYDYDEADHAAEVVYDGYDEPAQDWISFYNSEPTTLEFLWKRSSMDNDSISAALQYAARTTDMKDFPFLLDYCTLAYNIADDDNTYCGDGPGSKAYRKIVRHLHQKMHSVRYSAVIKAYGELIASYIPWDTYVDNGYRRMVDLLILSYDDLAAENNFAAVFEVMDEPNYTHDYDYYYDNLLPYITRSNLRKFKTDGEVDKMLVVWAYSFWGRRYNEGKVEDVRATLELFRDLYAG